MKKILFIVYILLLGTCVFAIPKYSVGEWTEAGHGNHRAVIDVTDSSDYNYVKIEWRRRDKDPDTKSFVIESENGETIEDYAIKSIGREYCEMIFRPVSKGKYYLYYLPYNPNGKYTSTPNYFFRTKPFSEKALEKLNSVGSLPKAQCNEIQSRKYEEELKPDFNSMYPMEVVATEAEVKNLREKYKDESFILFPEDRSNPIKMFEDIPYHWAVNGPKYNFEGTAKPYEYYVFNVGMYALKDIEKIKAEINDLKGEKGSVSAKDITCFNLGGTDWLGREFSKTVNIKDGHTQALWFGISVPKDAKGVYEGTFKIGAENAPMKEFKVKINVSGEILSDRGDSDIFSFARLRWLNDTSYLFDDTVVNPYIPLEYKNNGYSILDRKIDFDSVGMMKKYTSRGLQIFAGNMEFNIFANGEKLPFDNLKSGWIKQDKATGIFKSSAENEKLSREVTARAEFDGCINYDVKLTAKTDVSLDDVNMIIPLKKDCAEYMMGLGHVGGFRPFSWHWKWQPSHTDHQLWIGGPDAGFQLELNDESNNMYALDFGKYGCPKSWDNNSRGGIDIDEKGSKVLIKSYSGRRFLKAGEEIVYHYKMILTPFHKQSMDRFNYRYEFYNGTRSTQWHSGRYSEYINYPIYNVPALGKEFELRSYAKSYPGYYADIKGMKSGTIHMEVTPTYTFDSPIEIFLPVWTCIFNDENENLYAEIGLNKKDQFIKTTCGLGDDEDAAGAKAEELAPGKKAVLSFVWGDSLKVFVNGKLIQETKLKHSPVSGTKSIKFEGPFEYGRILVDKSQYNGGEVDFAKSENTLYFCEKNPILDGHDMNRFDGIYFTTRELSANCPEIFMLESLGDEVLSRHNNVTGADSILDSTGIVYPWVREHLEEDLLPGWHCSAANGAVDSSVVDFHLSRWQNFYVNGMNYLIKNAPYIKGYYIDGMSHDREIMKRNARIFEKYRGTDYYMQIHCADQFGQRGSRFNSTNINAEMFAYGTDLWLGEFYYYQMSPSNWLTDISGVVFGVPTNNLDFSYYGDFPLYPYRTCLFGMGFSGGLPFGSIWNVWDEFGITKSEMSPWWNKKTAVDVVYNDNGKKEKISKKVSDPILATSFVKKGEKTLIVIASWQDKDRTVALDIDWKALGIDKNKAKFTAPFVLDLQERQENINPDSINIKANTGLILLVE